MRTRERRPAQRRARPMLGFRVTLFLLLLPLAAEAGETLLERPIVFCQLAIETAPTEPLADGMLPADYGVGARLMRLEPSGQLIELAPDFTSACDPDISFDGERVLFAGQKVPGDPWNIWEVGADGSGLRQITDEALDARHPIYLATLYTITSSEPWYTILFVGNDGTLNETGTAPGTSLYTVRLDGSERRRITFHPGNDRTPFLMQDGLLVFAGWRLPRESAGAGGRVGLFGLQTDGVDYAAYAGSDGMRVQHMPTLTSEHTLVFVEADSVGWDGAGRLAMVDTARPHHTYRALTSDADGLFHSPSPMSGDTVLVSHRTPTGALRIVRFSTSEGLLETLYEDPAHHLLHARLLAPRPEPDGRSSTVRPESPTGKLFGLNVYESDAEVATVPAGSVKTVRVIEGVPLEMPRTLPSGPIGASGVFSRVFRRLLGEAPVEEDGSFHLDIPADLPVQLQLVDENGLAVATCDWIWVKQREFRGCIGCHEDPELTPPNRFVEAAARPANELAPPPHMRVSVAFLEHVAPVLRARCQSCHQSPDSPPHLAELDGIEGERAAYYALLDGLVLPGRARNSPLVWKLLGREEANTDHAQLLEEQEKALFIEWIDLGAQWSSGPDR